MDFESIAGISDSNSLATTIKNPILIVEDNNLSRSMITENILNYWNVEFHTASTYEEAKQYLKKHRFEYLVAICDLNLPDAPDGEILDLVDKAEVRFIALTGAFDRQTRKTLSKKYFVDYILKDSKNSYDYVAKLVGRLYKNQFKKVLVAEDSPSALALLCEILGLLNFQVYQAKNGKEAYEILYKNQDIRLAITDYEMPEMDGYEFTVKARDMLDKNELAIIGLSASDRTDLGAMFLKKGANDFILKPYSFEELLCRINMNMDTLEHLDYIEEIANTDALTGLYNRRHLQSYLNSQVNNLLSETSNYSLAFFDIDAFKPINTEHGDDCGDAVMVYFAKQLRSFFQNAFIARFSAEKFAVILDGVHKQKVVDLLNEFRELIELKSIQWSDIVINITVSIGATTNNHDSLEAFLNKAEDNLYRAKRSGRNTVVFK